MRKFVLSYVKIQIYQRYRMKSMKNKFRYILFSAAAAVAAILSGCCHAEVIMRPAPQEISSQRINNLQPVVTGEAINRGYYLFNTWPIYTGDPLKYNRKDYHSFFNDITKGRNASMLLGAMQRNYKIEQMYDIQHSESSWGYFSLWIIWRKTIVTKAVGLKTPEQVKNKDNKSDKQKKSRRRRIKSLK